MPYETVTELDQLLDRIKSYYADADLGLVRKAYEFSAKAHVGQLRLSGEPYVQHPIAVAGVLTSLKTDVTAIVAALLHDTLEDTVATPDELEREFGKDVVHLVDGVTKIGKITFRSYEEKQAENFPQDGAVDGGRYPGRPHQARRQTAQHAHLGASPAGQAEGDRPGDAGDLCAVGESPWNRMDQE
jgi:Guanosine polyphosphate pyrophosphohydrolases/synthetases